MASLRSSTMVFLCALVLVLAGGCATPPPLQEQAIADPPEGEENVDLSCSYFYFLWGTHAEYTQHFDEALEAYEKALICDPTNEYVHKKLPILLIKMEQEEQAATWLRNYVLQYPEDTTQLQLLARLTIRQGNITEAIKIYNRVIALEPDNQMVKLRLGVLYSQIKDYESAEKFFKEVLKQNSESYYSCLYLARLYAQLDRKADATDYYRRALDLNWSQDLVYEMADYYKLQEDYSQTLQLYTSLIEKNPQDERAGLGRAQIHLLMDNEKKALEELARIKTFSKSPLKIDLVTSRIYLGAQKIEKAKELLRTITTHHNSAEAHYLLGVISLEQKEYQKALSSLEQIEASSDSYGDAIYLRVKIFRLIEQPDRALGLLLQNIETEETRQPIFYTLLASLYQEKDDVTSSIATLSDGIAIYPDNEQLYFELALLLEKTGRYEEAVAKMQKVLELQPQHPEALNFIGYTWADNNIHLDKALIYIRQAVQQKPDNGFIRDSLGWVYYRLGDLDRARTELELSLELEPNDPHIHDHLGDVYRDLHLIDKALEHYSKALEMFTDEQKKKMVSTKIDALTKQ